VETNPPGSRRLVEVKASDCLFYVLAQGLPVIGLRENAFGEALRHKTPIAFLSHLEDEFVHAGELTPTGVSSQADVLSLLSPRPTRWGARKPLSAVASYCFDQASLLTVDSTGNRSDAGDALAQS